MIPTDEQVKARDFFQSGLALKINAFAGTGKTSTLKLLAESRVQSGLYLAFNRAIAKEARIKFPRHMDCKTTHALAFHSLLNEYNSNHSKLTSQINGHAARTILNLENETVGELVTIDSVGLGYLVIGTINNYCHSNEEHLSTTHVPFRNIYGLLKFEELASLKEFVVSLSKRLWIKMADPEDSTTLGHNGYLKVWALSRPRLSYSYILLDEAQDTNPVVLDVLTRQDCQVVFVGDKHQQIYEWRKAVNAMESIDTTHVAYLTKSFRFGPKIASAANLLLELLGERNPLTGNEDKNSKLVCTQPNTVLCRTNTEVIAQLLIMLREGRKVAILQGSTELESLLKSVSYLKNNRPSAHPEFFGFKNWKEVVEFSRGDDGAHLQTFVTLVEEHGEEQLLDALNRTVSDEKDADVVVSTAHKAKGCEWNSVSLAEDFSKPKFKDGDCEFDKEELRLLYVALTRAKDAVNVNSAYDSYIQCLRLKNNRT